MKTNKYKFKLTKMTIQAGTLGFLLVLLISTISKDLSSLGVPVLWIILNIIIMFIIDVLINVIDNN